MTRQVDNVRALASGHTGRTSGRQPKQKKREESSALSSLAGNVLSGGQAEKLDPHPQVCFAFGFLKENPLWPNCPST
jgi:hypothetical protein